MGLIAASFAAIAAGRIMYNRGVEDAKNRRPANPGFFWNHVLSQLEAHAGGLEDDSNTIAEFENAGRTEYFKGYSAGTEELNRQDRKGAYL